RGDASALRDVEHGIITEHRHAPFAGRLDCLDHVQPLPQHDRARVFDLADVAAHFLGLFEREPERRLVRHRMNHEHVHAPVWLPADPILREHVSARPGLVPGNGSLFEERNRPIGDYLIHCVFHGYSFLPPPAATGMPWFLVTLDRGWAALSAKSKLEVVAYMA